MQCKQYEMENCIVQSFCKYERLTFFRHTLYCTIVNLVPGDYCLGHTVLSVPYHWLLL